MTNYGITLKWDLETQELTIESGNPIYQHSVARHYLWVNADLPVGNLLDVTFSQNGQTTYATTMNYVELGKYRIEMPDIVLANEGTMRISLAVKSPIIVGNTVKYSVLTSGIINATIITSIAEPIVNPVTPSEADKLNARMTELTDEVIEFEKDVNATLDSFVAPTIDVGTTTTVSPSEQAKVTNSGTDKFAVFNFEIPQGIKGDKGEKGDRGMTLRLWYAYDVNQTYVNNEDFIDLVSYGGTTFAPNVDTQGNTPTEGEFWGVVAIKGTDGKNFQISEVFTSIAEMNAHFADYIVGDFVMIENGEQDPDSGKLFVKSQTQWEFVTDLSGSQGIQGVSIDNVMLTSSNGLVDTYTIYYSNNTTSTYSLTNGSRIFSSLVSYDGTNYTVANIVQAKVGEYVIGKGGQYEGVFGQISSVGTSSSILSNAISLRGTKWFSGVVQVVNGVYTTPNIEGAIVGDFVISTVGTALKIIEIGTETKLELIVNLNGKSAFVRYSAYPDGTAFTSSWVAGQKYVGIATGLTASTVASGYTWSLFVGLDGKDGTDGTDGKTIWQAVISFDGTNYTVANVEKATVGDYVMGLSGAYAGYFGVISNVGATVSTLTDVVNLNGADGSGAGNVIATNSTVTQGTKYVYNAVAKDTSGNISGEFVDVQTLGFLPQTAVVNARSEESDKVYSAKYVEDTFAPKSFFENLYLNRVTDTTANLTLNKPNVAVGNFLVATSANTSINWTTPETTLTRTFQSNIQFDGKTAVSVVLDVAFNRNASVEYGAVVLINNNAVSTQQAFGLTSFNGDTNFTNVYGIKFDVILDLIVSPTTFNVGDVMTVRIFKRQSVTTALTTRTFCGVTVSGSARFSYLSYNFTALSLNTNQIADGAITLPKIDPNAIDVLPTQGSVKLVTSGGVFDDLALKQNNLTFDSTPTQGSENPVKSGGIFTRLAGKQNNLIFDSEPTQGSENVVTSGGVYASLAEKQTKNIVVSNISVPTSAWVADSLFEFCATVTVTEAREIHVPNVFFDIDGSALKILYNFSSCTDGTVKIYASEIPTVTVVIDKIVFYV